MKSYLSLVKSYLSFMKPKMSLLRFPCEPRGSGTAYPETVVCETKDDGIGTRVGHGEPKHTVVDDGCSSGDKVNKFKISY